MIYVDTSIAFLLTLSSPANVVPCGRTLELCSVVACRVSPALGGRGQSPAAAAFCETCPGDQLVIDARSPRGAAVGPSLR
ncbi:hypothetical protein HPB50_004599 [Hyalomma asiaticum]|uniref:Uncharacterized protein n=1 Tax=Hyalomma asiaticum TaxID=266040 RepID=A0ACB7TB24_HYAAI|nr:hypothetical protein HPB50_004599 [Hyalomma asiaticum]